MCLYLSVFIRRKHLYLSQLLCQTFINSHLKCNILHSSCKNVLSSAHLNKLFNYRMQQLKVQFSIPCLVKAFAQMRSEVTHGPAVPMKINNVELPRASIRAWNNCCLILCCLHNRIHHQGFILRSNFWPRYKKNSSLVYTCSYFWRCNYTHYPKARGQVKTRSKNQMLNWWWWCKGLEQLLMLSSHWILSPLKALWIFPLTSMGFRSGSEQFFKNLRQIKTISFGMRLFTPLGEDYFLSKHSFHTQVTSAEFLFLPKASFFKEAGSMFLLIFHRLASKLFLFKLSKTSPAGQATPTTKNAEHFRKLWLFKTLFFKMETPFRFYVLRDCPYTLQPVHSGRLFHLKCMAPWQRL